MRGRRGQPQAGGERAAFHLVQQFAGGAEVADVGHAGADEDFVDLDAGHLREGLGVVRIVRAAEDGFLDLGQVDLVHGRVFGVFVGAQQAGLGQPLFWSGSATSIEKLSLLYLFGMTHIEPYGFLYTLEPCRDFLSR